MKKIFIILFIISLSYFVQAQDSNLSRVRVGESEGTAKNQFDISRLTFSGGLGLQFGDYTLINIAPQVGYNFTDNLNAGGGFSYTYLKDSEYINGTKWTEKRSYVGMNIYAKYYPITNLILMLQPDINRMWQSFDNNTNQGISKSKFVPALLVGAGFRYGPMEAMLQYDVVQNEHSPYGNTIFYSVGYTWNF